MKIMKGPWRYLLLSILLLVAAGAGIYGLLSKGIASKNPQKALEWEAYRLSGPIAYDCGSSNGIDFVYPSPADECAAYRFKRGMPFRAHACYWQTDTAGCYWIAGNLSGKVHYIFYTYYSMGDEVGSPYGCDNCGGKPVIAECLDPIIISKYDREAIQCPSFPSEWRDTFHIVY